MFSLSARSSLLLNCRLSSVFLYVYYALICALQHVIWKQIERELIVFIYWMDWWIIVFVVCVRNRCYTWLCITYKLHVHIIWLTEYNFKLVLRIYIFSEVEPYRLSNKKKYFLEEQDDAFWQDQMLTFQKIFLFYQICGIDRIHILRAHMKPSYPEHFISFFIIYRSVKVNS